MRATYRCSDVARPNQDEQLHRVEYNLGSLATVVLGHKWCASSTTKGSRNTNDASFFPVRQATAEKSKGSLSISGSREIIITGSWLPYHKLGGQLCGHPNDDDDDD